MEIPQRPLGKSGVRLPKLGFGGAPLGELFQRIPEAQAQATLQTAWDCGLYYFDTAPWYGHGLSEHRIGHLLRQQVPGSFFCSTKVGRVYSHFQGEAVNHDPRIHVETFEGLLVDYVREKEAAIVLRGLRAISDFEYEFQMAHMNRKMAPQIETVFMMAGEEHFYISSGLVKEIVSLGGDVSAHVPSHVLKALKDRT